MNFLLRSASVVLAFFFLNACTALQRSRESVIEKSSETRPLWLSDDGLVGLESQKFIYVTLTNEDVYRLELGIKQIQTALADKTQQLFDERIGMELKRLTKIADQGLSPSFVDEVILNAKSRYRVQSRAVPEAVYWEHVRTETQDGPHLFYRISVLGALPRGELEQGLGETLKFLKTLPGEQPKKLIQIIEKSSVTPSDSVDVPSESHIPSSPSSED